MDISNLLTNTCQWQQRDTTTNDLNMPSYSPAQTIPCLIRPRDIYSPLGNSMVPVSINEYTTTQKISSRDIIDGQVVLAVKEIYDFDSSIIGYISKIGRSVMTED